MKGLELSKKYYKAFGEPMLERDFADILPHCAVGLCGEGSECLGYDDDISSDHDFEPGFCIFIPDDTDERTIFKLERAYAKLPAEFEGFKREKLSPVGGNRHGVIKAGDFFEKYVGSRDGKLSLYGWATIDASFLLTATNGEIFRDDGGEFSAVRAYLSDMPRDAWLKRLAGNLIMAKQAGQYNYMRCVSHGEGGAAQLAVIEFVKNAVSAIFLLNHKYKPFYKWTFRAMRELDTLGTLADAMEFLISTENTKTTVDTKYGIIEDIAGMIIEELQNIGITDAVCGDLEKHAYSVNDKIKDNDLRQMNIMTTV